MSIGRADRGKPMGRKLGMRCSLPSSCTNKCQKNLLLKELKRQQNYHKKDSYVKKWQLPRQWGYFSPVGNNIYYASAICEHPSQKRFFSKKIFPLENRLFPLCNFAPFYPTFALTDPEAILNILLNCFFPSPPFFLRYKTAQPFQAKISFRSSIFVDMVEEDAPEGEENIPQSLTD